MMAQEVNLDLSPEQKEFYLTLSTRIEGVDLSLASRRLLTTYFANPISTPVIDVLMRRDGDFGPDDRFRQRFVGRLFEDTGFLGYQEDQVARTNGAVYVASPNETLNLFSAMFPDNPQVQDEDGLNRGLEGVSVPDVVVAIQLPLHHMSNQGVQTIRQIWTWDTIIDFSASPYGILLKNGKFDRNQNRIRLIKKGLRNIDADRAGKLIGLNAPVVMRDIPPMRAKVIMAANEGGDPHHAFTRKELKQLANIFLGQSDQI